MQTECDTPFRYELAHVSTLAICVSVTWLLKFKIFCDVHFSYFFPDVSTLSESSANIAIVLGADVSEMDRILLDELLKDYAAFQEQPRIEVNPDDVTVGQKVSDGIVSGKSG